MNQQPGQPLPPVRTFTLGEVRSVAFSPDGRYVVQGGAAVILIDVPGNKILRAFAGHTGLVNAVAFSPDGTRLATGSVDKTIKLWEVSSGSEIRILIGHSATVNSVAFNPIGSLLASGSADATIKLWAIGVR